MTDLQIAPMPSTGPDLTETTTAPREPTDAEPQVAEHPVAEPASLETNAPEHAAPEQVVHTHHESETVSFQVIVGRKINRSTRTVSGDGEQRVTANFGEH